MRLLDKDKLMLDMTKLGFEPESLDEVRERDPAAVRHGARHRPDRQRQDHHALLGDRRRSTRPKPTSSPPRIRSSSTSPASTRCRCSENIGLNFAAALRSFLRQDPDIILVGEIRDFETAEIAVKAALTGHLVLSTLHTNDAPSTITRLMNMGIEPFLVASSVQPDLRAAPRAPHLRRLQGADSRTPPQALVEAGFTPDEARTRRAA